jgi:hypothetical protein
MGELRVRFSGNTVVLAEDDSLGFGRSVVSPSASKGWGYGGRFLELGPSPHLHRIWGEIVWRDHRWIVRSLGDRDPITVVVTGRPRVELPARREGAEAAEHPLTDGSAALVLSSVQSSFVIECATSDGTPAPTFSMPSEGDRTTTLGGLLADSIGEQEFRVLWAMSREYRSGEVNDPQPLSYPRVVLALGLRTEKQASRSVERLKERFVAAGLFPVDVTSERQRDWMCRFAVRHQLLDRLVERFGGAPTD